MTSCPHCTNPRCWRINPPDTFEEVPAPFPAVPIPASFELPATTKRELRHELGKGAEAPLAHLRSIASEFIGLQRAKKTPQTRAEAAKWDQYDQRVRERTDKQVQRYRLHMRKLIQALAPDSMLASWAEDAQLNRVAIVQMLRDLEAATMGAAGAPHHDRRFELNIAVVIQHVGIPLETSRGGLGRGQYWRIRNLMYDAVGVEVPADGYYGLTKVIEAVKAGEWSWCAYEYDVRLNAVLRRAAQAPDVKSWRMVP